MTNCSEARISVDMSNCPVANRKKPEIKGVDRHATRGHFCVRTDAHSNGIKSTFIFIISKTQLNFLGKIVRLESILKAIGKRSN